MTSRRFNLIEDSFSSGYSRAGRFGQRSRADQIHHSRSGIDRRRHHSLNLDSATIGAATAAYNAQQSKSQVGGGSQQRRDNFATQTKTTFGSQQQLSGENGGLRGIGGGRGVHFSEIQENFFQAPPEKQQSSTNRGIHIDFENEQDSRSRNAISRQENERYLDGGSMSRSARPQRGSSYYNEVLSSSEAPLSSFRENTSQNIRQQSDYQQDHQGRDFTDTGQRQTSMHASQPNIVREEVVWQPVKVIYVEKTPSEIRQSGTAPRRTEYSSSSSYGQERRQAAPQQQQSSFSNDWGGRQWDEGYVNRAHGPPSYATWNGNVNGDHRSIELESQWTPPHSSRDGSYRRSTEVVQSRAEPTTSNWNGNYQMVKTQPQRSDYKDGVSSSRSWASNSSASLGRESGYPARIEQTTYSQNGTLRSGGNDRLTPGFADHGNDSFAYRSESRNSPRLLQNTSLNGSAFGTRSQGRQVHVAQDDERPRSSMLNFRGSSGLDLNGQRSGGFQEEFRSQTNTSEAEEKEFFGKMMKELESQRQTLKPEVDKLIRNSSIVTNDSDLTSSMNSLTLEAGKNSYIDTSLPTPVFKAYVDIKEFSPKSVKVNYDPATNKVVVEASQFNAQGTVGKTFTQKIAMPKYADDLRLIARMNSRGILRIEVPLLFYFPEEQEDNKARSFLYEATRNATDGSRALEIVVKPGSDYSLQDIQPEVIDNTLIVWGGRGKQKKSIGRYVLPPTANIKNIIQRNGTDGSLTIIIPVT